MAGRRSMPPPPPELFEHIRRRHGHYCPMSTLGGRLGHAARQHLLPEAARYGCYFLDTCAVDGIIVASDCATIAVRDGGRHALWLVDEGGRGVFVELLPAILARAAQYRTFDQALERERAGMSPAELTARQAARDALLDELLRELRTLPDAALLTVSSRLPAELDGGDATAAPPRA